MINTQALKTLVMIHQTDLAKLTPKDRRKKVLGLSELLSSQGEALVVGDIGCGSMLDKAALGIAALSFEVGGIDLFGVHWEWKR